MKSRVTLDSLTEIRQITRVLKDQWQWRFICFDNYGDPVDISAGSAALNFSVAGASDQVLTKAATIASGTMTFSFASADFSEAGDYYYQLVITEGGLTYTIATGCLTLLEKVE